MHLEYAANMRRKSRGKPILIVVAGAQGSGKTTLTEKLLNKGIDIGYQVGADRIIERAKEEKGIRIKIEKAKAISDHLKKCCIRKRVNFCYETALQRITNVEFMRRAREEGFYIVLYFIGTAHEQINIERIGFRVARGGHEVPTEVVKAGITKSEELLMFAIRLSDEIRIYDNTREYEIGEEKPVLVAKKVQGKLREFKKPAKSLK